MDTMEQNSTREAVTPLVKKIRIFVEPKSSLQYPQKNITGPYLVQWTDTSKN
jgi:hypothetical protein